jgi:Fe-S-cluster containining protein
MDLIEKNVRGMGSGEFGVDIPVTAQESCVRDAYLAVDEATASGLDRLRSEEGIVPTCKLGCSCCCRYHIPVNIAEAHTLAQYVRRELSIDQIAALRLRTQQWHEWDNSRPGRYRSPNIGTEMDLSNYDHGCPLLVDGACIAYPVRPIVCRTHYVSSLPLFCCAATDPQSTEAAPVTLKSVVTATDPFSRVIEDHIERAGLDVSRSIMLLPHWLAINMGWEFALSL